MRQIPLSRVDRRTGGETREARYALVDDADYEDLARHRWHSILVRKTGMVYAARGVWDSERRVARQVLMHREVARAIEGFHVIHLNGNGLDNRRGNVRLVTRGVAVQRAGIRARKEGVGKPAGRFVGVHWHTNRFIWTARIKVGGKFKHLGSTHDEEEAARMYDRAARAVYGELARVNFPEISPAP